MDLAHNQPVLDFFASFDPNSFVTTIVFLLIGSVLTMCVQSSAAIMAITMILCSSGVLPIYQGIALVMGENIGTTVTSNIAALTANTQARRAAFAHMFFNVFGVIGMLLVFKPFINMVCGFVGFDEFMTKGDPHFLANVAKLSFVLAAFHTTFNITNTCILVGFIKQIEKIVCFVIKPKAQADEDEFRLHFIQTGIMKTPELSVLEAQKEITSFAERIHRMFGMVQTLLIEKDEKAFLKVYSRIEKYEGISDNMEVEIANMARTINRRFTSKEDFTPQQYEHIHQMFNLTNNALEQMNYMFNHTRETIDVNHSFNIENEINNYRDQLRTQNINDVNSHAYTYTIGTMYMDLIQECEKLGDYVVNVVEARMNTKQREA